ncbi:integrase/recombinase xerD homolog [Gastrophryne carolinensis]
MDRQGLLIWYVSDLVSKGETPASVDRKMSAMAFLCRLEGWADMTKSFWVRQALKGWRKGHRGVDSRRPVSWGLLRGLIEVLPRVCTAGFEVSLFKAAFSLAFFGALRVGELVSPNKRLPGGLEVGDVVAADEGVVVPIGKSKTDQRGRGVSVFLGRLQHCSSCPAAAFEEFMGIRPPGNGPLLVHEDGSFLSRFQFLAVFRKCLKELGLASGDYGTHSFRIGAATEAARLGLPEEIIKRLGRWESTRFRRYVRLDRIDQSYR